MSVEITMPQLSDTMSEGKILSWLKKEGDAVKRGDALAEVATDKADLEIESFHAGTLVKILASEGQTIKVGSVIAVIGEAGESAVAAPKTAESTPKAEPEPSPEPVKAVRTAPQVHVSAPAPAPANGHDGERVKISPLARNVADSLGVDFKEIRGTGEGGRIVKRDVESYAGKEAPAPGVAIPAPVPSPKPVATRAPITPVPESRSGSEALSRMRQTIANRMVEAKTTIPHFYMTAKIQVDALAKLKDSLKPLPQYEGLTYNHLILRAVALSLRAVPRVNSSYVEGGLFQPAEVNIGIVTAIPDGLLIPVLKRADQVPLADIVPEAKALVQRARTGRPKADDLMGGTFSISNMGMFPVESFSAIINPGQGGILAVSSILEEPVVVEGQVRPGKVMRATLSVDHGIIDGIVAGEFLGELKRLIEDPVLLLA